MATPKYTPDFTPEELASEEWRPVPDFSGYEVSNLGRVRSWLKSGGRGGLSSIPAILKPAIIRDGRLRITPRRDGKTYSVAIHRLVLSAFVGQCPDGMQACHYDDNCTNNRLVNLRWDTLEANLADQARNGKVLMGESNGHSRLTEKQIVEIRERYASGEKSRDLALEFGVIRTHITDITGGRTWKHVGGPISHEPGCFKVGGRR